MTVSSQVETALLVAGTETPAGDGVSGALRCVIRLSDGSLRAAVIKRAGLNEVAAEIFAALLLKAWKLPVPDVYLIDEGGAITFASSDSGYPNLKHHLGIQSIPPGPARDAAAACAAAVAISLPSAPLAAVCDESIGNRDRNLGNILWDGVNESWIDHAASFGNSSHMPDDNKLCVMAGSDQDRFVRAAVASALMLDRGTPNVASESAKISFGTDFGYAEFVAKRLSAIGNRIILRFPLAPDLLSQP